MSLMLAGAAGPAAAMSADAGSTARTGASVSIIAPEAPPQLLAAAGTSTAALDGNGRALSVSLPTRMILRGDAPADEIAARTALAPARAGTARLMLTPVGALRPGAAVGAYVGELRMSLDYN